MLLNLHVKNLALIQEIDICFEKGLNILSGETGAGKSILIGSVNTALGGRVSKDMIGQYGDQAMVELIFSVEDQRQKNILREMGIFHTEEEAADGQVILSRRILGSRSISKVNGESYPLSKIKEIAELLIDIHGQHEHQSLLNKKKHLEILDEYAKEALKEPKNQLKEAYLHYRSLEKELREFSLLEEDRIHKLSFMEYELKEIEEAALRPGEDEELEAMYKKMNHAKTILDTASSVYLSTGYEQPSSAGETIGKALRDFQAIASLDEELEPVAAQLADVDALLNDFNRELSAYMEGMQFESEEFQETEERLDLINRLKAKYGQSIEEIFAYRDGRIKEKQRLEDYDARLLELQQEVKAAKKHLEKLCGKVSDIRKKHAKKLTRSIQEGLIDLNFLDVRFEMQFEKMENYTAGGTDSAVFLISTNPGESLRPLNQIASGGELSRIMLAIKTILADQDAVDTLIFDEIDVGISGRTAQMVSEKLAVIGNKHQVICITHLPQIAAMSDIHFLIEKDVKNKHTAVQIQKLSEEQSIEELGRILGGAEITDAVLENAREMKKLARIKKGK